LIGGARHKTLLELSIGSNFDCAATQLPQLSL